MTVQPNNPLTARALAKYLDRKGDAQVVIVLDGHAVPVVAAEVINPALLKDGDRSPVFLALVNEYEFGEYAAYGGNVTATRAEVAAYIKDRYPVKLSEVFE